MNPAIPLICPLCRERLYSGDKSLICPSGHNYDLARQGYVNLLAGQPKVRIAGDSREMVQARRRFLAAGYYQPLSDLLHEVAGGVLGGKEPLGEEAVVLDAGCGEGSTGRELRQSLRGAGIKVALAGLNLAKTAVQAAAASDKAGVYLVADVHKFIPLADSTVDLLLNNFAPRNAGEFDRVLAPGGSLLFVIPGPGHLEPLGHTLPLLSAKEGKEERIQEAFHGYALRQRQELRFEMGLEGEDLLDLLRMTPSFWHFADKDWQRASRLAPLTVQAAMVLLVLERM